ncbi:MAG TPA: hypothetical protein PLQ35_12350 [bacterium]|nr:hypothetical protein [bacterium]HQL63077.1 hypothetical protein [bacterium]
MWLSTSKYGIGLTADSIHYISAANNLADGNGLVEYDGIPQVSWPPLYACLLALLSLASIPIPSGARVIHAILFAVILFCSGEIFRRHCRSRWLVLFAIFMLSVSYSLVSISICMWSEPLFIVLLLLTVLLIPSCFRRQSIRRLLAVSLLTALFCLQRYIGVTLALTISAIILAYWPESSRRKRVVLSVGFLIVSCFPLVLYLIRNYMLTSTLTGYRGSSPNTLYDNIHYLLDGISIWFIPVEIPLWIREVLLLLFGGAAGIHILYKIWQGRRSPTRDVQVPVMALFTWIYILTLVALSTTVAFQRIANRFLLPIYVFVVFLFVKSADDLLGHYSHVRLQKTVVSIFLVALSFCWMGYMIPHIHGKVVHHRKCGTGEYNIERWKESDMIRVIQREPIQGKIFSNAADIMYIFTDRPATMGPFRAETIEEFREKLSKDGPNYLVWFDACRKDYIYNLDEIQSIFALELIRECQDGAIYRIRD